MKMKQKNKIRRSNILDALFGVRSYLNISNNEKDRGFGVWVKNPKISKETFFFLDQLIKGLKNVVPTISQEEKRAKYFEMEAMTTRLKNNMDTSAIVSRIQQYE